MPENRQILTLQAVLSLDEIGEGWDSFKIFEWMLHREGYAGAELRYRRHSESYFLNGIVTLFEVVRA